MTLERVDTVIAFAVIMLGVSLLITIATQIISSLLALRGANLLWGIKTVLVDCGITSQPDESERIAREVLTDSSISDSVFSRFADSKYIGPLTRRWRLASAIRPDELARSLAKIATSTPALSTAIGTALSTVDEVAKRKLQTLQAQLLPGGGAWSVAADKVIQQAADSARQSVLKLEISFATAMDRVAQRFAMKTRFCAVILAFLVTFGAHLDSLQLLKQLATNPEQRDALAGMREAMLEQARSVIPTPEQAESAAEPAAASPPYPVVAPAILKEAMDNLKRTATDSSLPETHLFASYTEAVNWLGQNGQAALEPRYQQAVVSALEQHATDISSQLAESNFTLIQSPYHWWPLVESGRNLLGILITAAFLSLGAPFWFNALKNLGNLRTVVAANEKRETGKA